MVYLQTKNPYFEIFWRALEWKLEYFLAISNSLLPLDIVYGPFLQLVAFWNIFSRFGMLYQAQSGNPGRKSPTYIHTY
jgi:hypothetical protein